MKDWHRRRSVVDKLRSRVHKLTWPIMPNSAVARVIDRRLTSRGAYWLFILGMNNSGTTLLAQMIRRHPYVRSLPVEGQFLTHAIPSDKRLGLKRVWGTELERVRMTERDDAKPALRVKYDWSLWYSKGPGVLLEKSSTNAVRGRWFQANFQPAKFVLLFRHPYAVVEGIVRRTGCPLDVAALHYRNVARAMIDDFEILQEALLIKYEDVTDDTENVINKLGAFTGLDFNPVERYLEGIGAHSIEGHTTGVTNLNARSFAALGDGDRRVLRRILGREMDELGYIEPQRGA